MAKNKNILKLYISLVLFFSNLSVKAQNIFIENKGQFPKQVNAKVNLPSGIYCIQRKLMRSFC